jgi:serine/threonine-protein kinase
VGQPPFTGPTASDIMHKQRFARFDPPKNHVPEIPGWLNEIVCQLLEKEPDKRPPDAFVTSKRLQEVVKKVELFETGFVASSSDITTAENAIVEKPLGGTFVRDLLRLQVSNREPTTLVERALNNTWVLLTLLLLVTLGAGGLFWQTRRSTETNDVNSTTITEAERILQSARWRWKGGDSDSALKQLDALQALIQHDPHQQSLVHSIERLRTAIGKQTRTPDQPEFVEQALKRASELAPEQQAEAQKIYEGIIALYQSDPRLDDYVAQAQAKLKEIQEPPAQ